MNVSSPDFNPTLSDVDDEDDEDTVFQGKLTMNNLWLYTKLMYFSYKE